MRHAINVDNANSKKFITELFANGSSTPFLCANQHDVSVFGLLCEAHPSLALQVLNDLPKDKGQRHEVINSGVPSPLWQAVCYDQVQVVQALLDMDECQVDKEAPDGTYPLLMALARGQQDIINLFRAKMSQEAFVKQQLALGIKPEDDPYPLEWNTEAVTSESYNLLHKLKVPDDLQRDLLEQLDEYWTPRNDTLMDMSKKFPSFNETDSTSDKLLAMKQDATRVKVLDVEGLKAILLAEFCTIKAYKRRSKTKDETSLKVLVKDLDLDVPCDDNCNQ